MSELDKSNVIIKQNNSEKVMQKGVERKALGRGLAALLGGDEQETFNNEESETQKISAGVAEILLSQITPNPDQPRKSFNQEKLNELAESIKEQGVIQPILVKKVAEQSYQIIAGERRYRASKIAGLENIPAVVQSEQKSEAHNELASVIENIQREELNPIELSEAYSYLLKKYDYTQEQLSKKLGVSRVSLANTLRLSRLPKSAKEYIVQGRVSEGHGRALLGLENGDEIAGLCQKIVDSGLTVRATEQLVRDKNEPKQEVSSTQYLKEKNIPEKDPNVIAVEDELRQKLGTKVHLKGGMKRGIMEIYYTGEDSFNRILHMLRNIES